MYYVVPPFILALPHAPTEKKCATYCEGEDFFGVQSSTEVRVYLVPTYYGARRKSVRGNIKRKLRNYLRIISEHQTLFFL